MPSVLKQRIIAVYEAFRHIEREIGLPFFKNGIVEKINAALRHVENGRLSDTPELSLYCGTSGNTMSCGWGSSALEVFHRHLQGAFPGFSYGAELFDSVLSEHIFRTNARAISRSNSNSTPRSISEVVAFERLHSLCLACDIQIPNMISNGLKPLPLNNDEIFGLEDIGDWARKVKTTMVPTEDMGIEEMREGDSVLDDEEFAGCNGIVTLSRIRLPRCNTEWLG